MKILNFASGFPTIAKSPISLDVLLKMFVTCSLKCSELSIVELLVELNLFLQILNYPILVCLTQTLLNKDEGDITLLGGYCLVSNYRLSVRKGGGVAIFERKNL